jgi:hypothetical protein
VAHRLKLAVMTGEKSQHDESCWLKGSSVYKAN